jgi:hypothetical protein
VRPSVTLRPIKPSAETQRAATSLAMPAGNGDQGRHILIAVARYLAAHFPTGRALLQTADIAQRLMRGGELDREAHAAE